MNLQSSTQIRDNKVFRPTEGLTSRSTALNTGNISNLNRVFVQVDVTQSLPRQMEIYGREVGGSLATALPILIDKVEPSQRLARINDIGTYLIEIDCSLSKTMQVIFAVADAGNFTWDDYAEIKVLVTSELKYNSGQKENYLKVLKPATISTKFETKLAKTLMAVVTTKSVPSTYFEFSVNNNSISKTIAPYDNQNQASEHRFLHTLTNGSVVSRITEDGTHYLFFDVSDADNITFAYTTSQLDVSFQLIEDAIIKDVNEFDISAQKIKELIDITPSERIVTGRASTLKLVVESLSSAQDISVRDIFGNGKYLKAYSSRIEGNESIYNVEYNGGIGFHTVLGDAGDYELYYDVTEVDVASIGFIDTNLNIKAITLSEEIYRGLIEVRNEFDYGVKTEVLSNQFVKVGTAKTLKVEVQPTVDVIDLAVEFTLTDALLYTERITPYSKIIDGVVPQEAIQGVTATGLGYFLKMQGNDRKTFYYDVSDRSEVKTLFSEARAEVFFTLLDEEMIPANEEIMYNAKDFNILKTDKKVFDCYNNTFVTDVSTTTGFNIGVNGYEGGFIWIDFNDTNFPNLIADSLIDVVYVLPDAINLIDRICVLTKKGQIYHNYPYRQASAQGTIQDGDFLKFDESVIWDLPTNETDRQHPSNDPAESREGYKYFPYLDSYAYSQTPAINQDNGYGNSGFPDTLEDGDFKRTRFYQFKEALAGEVDPPLHVLRGGLTKTKKISTLGAYQISGQRCCLFATEDGGRNWYATYEFDSTVQFGNSIDTTNAGAYIANSFTAEEVSNVFPTELVKEPTTMFSFSPSTPPDIVSISNSNPAIVTTASAHGIFNGRKVRLIKNSGGASGFDALANNDANVNSGGNGTFFKVKVLSTTTFELHEHIYSPSNNLQCRHIHYTNALKDYIAFGTGEEYPNAWVMLMSQDRVDNGTYPDLHKRNPPSFRLNSSVNGVQRLCSFWMLDDDAENPTIFFGADTIEMFRSELKIAGRTDLPSRKSIGIFKGKLADIDDASKFETVLDVEDLNIWASHFNSTIVAGFILGTCAVSVDNGETWEIVKMDEKLSVAWVDGKNDIYFRNGVKLVLK